MKSRPILFSAPMVLALLAGTKTQTRRIVKPEGAHHLFAFLDLPGDPTGEWAWCSSSHVVSKHIFCPYGQPGDRLWVRERAELTADECDIGCLNIRYLADRVLRDVGTIPGDCPGLVKWINGRWQRPSIHMPAWASRITLEVVSVRVERLQDISEADSRAEGIADGGCTECGNPEPCSCSNPSPDARDAYAALWEQINGAGSWAANPWTWAIEFRRIEQ